MDGAISRAAVGRRLAERILRGQDVTEAVFATMDAIKAGPGVVCPIGDVPEVSTGEVDIEGTIQTLWEPSNPAIQQVGLIADETGKIKFTSWKKSDPKIVQEGDTVRMRGSRRTGTRALFGGRDLPQPDRVPRARSVVGVAGRHPLLLVCAVTTTSRRLHGPGCSRCCAAGLSP